MLHPCNNPDYRKFPISIYKLLADGIYPPDSIYQLPGNNNRKRAISQFGLSGKPLSFFQTNIKYIKSIFIDSLYSCHDFFIVNPDRISTIVIAVSHIWGQSATHSHTFYCRIGSQPFNDKRCYASGFP